MKYEEQYMQSLLYYVAVIVAAALVLLVLPVVQSLHIYIYSIHH